MIQTRVMALAAAVTVQLGASSGNDAGKWWGTHIVSSSLCSILD